MQEELIILWVKYSFKDRTLHIAGEMQNLVMNPDGFVTTSDPPSKYTKSFDPWCIRNLRSLALLHSYCRQTSAILEKDNVN